MDATEVFRLSEIGQIERVRDRWPCRTMDSTLDF